MSPVSLFKFSREQAVKGAPIVRGTLTGTILNQSEPTLFVLSKQSTHPRAKEANEQRETRGLCDAVFNFGLVLRELLGTITLTKHGNI
jgi:hypothetical protein